MASPLEKALRANRAFRVMSRSEQKLARTTALAYSKFKKAPPPKLYARNAAATFSDLSESEVKGAIKAGRSVAEKIRGGGGGAGGGKSKGAGLKAGGRQH